MMMGKFNGKYRIESIRLKGFDYTSEGIYFITICAYEMQHLFGEIRNGHMHLSEIGKLAEKFWLEIPLHFANAQLDEFIIMPNHIHGILILTSQNVQTAHCVVSQENLNDLDKNSGKNAKNQTTPQTLKNDEINRCTENKSGAETTQCAVSTEHYKQDMAAIIPKPGSVSVIIGSYKSVVTKHARKIHADFRWLERFHDRIIRDNCEFQNVQNYIRNNPKNWRKDNEFFL